MIKRKISPEEFERIVKLHKEKYDNWATMCWKFMGYNSRQAFYKQLKKFGLSKKYCKPKINK
jgi:hypothetical protein